MPDLYEFYKGKRVLITGHMGFKGTWLCVLLTHLGAKVIGYGLPNDVSPEVYKISGVNDKITSLTADVRDLATMQYAFNEYKPEIVFHLAAQPIVLTGYKDPVTTYTTNVVGTLNLMECVRTSDFVKSVVNITTDKVYRNTETGNAFKEDDVLDGIDPYSNSKSCSELVTATYIRSFLKDKAIAVSTARAGNVLGGGDFSDNRIIPDCIRAQEGTGEIVLRNPDSVRPYQHVLEALYGYLLIAMNQYDDIKYAGSYNIGPDIENCLKTKEIAELFCKAWGDKAYVTVQKAANAPKESGLLRLDCMKFDSTFGKVKKLSVEQTIQMIVDWEKAFERGATMYDVFVKQIEEYLSYV